MAVPGIVIFLKRTVPPVQPTVSEAVPYPQTVSSQSQVGQSGGGQ